MFWARSKTTARKIVLENVFSVPLLSAISKFNIFRFFMQRRFFQANMLACFNPEILQFAVL